MIGSHSYFMCVCLLISLYLSEGVTSFQLHTHNSSSLKLFGVLPCIQGAALHSQTPAHSQPKFFPFRQGVTLYIQFSKVGSTSMRQLMRSVQHFEDICFIHSAYRTRGHFKIDPYSSVPARYLQHPGAIQSRPPLVQGTFGGCMKFKANTPCQYFTLLRHPVATLLSSYSYFCMSCREQHRFCRSGTKLRSRSGTHCPHLSFLEYARLRGNVYTKEFSLYYACNSGYCEKASCRTFEESCSSWLPEPDHLLKVAKANLRRHVFVLILEELFSCDQQRNNSSCITGIQLLSNVLQWPEMEQTSISHQNKSPARYNMSNQEKIEAESILWSDILLYNYATRLYHKYRKHYVNSKTETQTI